ncbi:MAG: hypothetical protein DBX91_14045 [Subdoligranulum variabile]|uniref:phage tail spike protein n=1 Tax=Gemmiger formicilis TaxID=745368 RepID=UPI000D7A5BCF|nr:MAG: hypothetical protein DBX91_14045 [Subdoligranulum variabile]
MREIASGYDEVVFNISIWDELYPQLIEEASIRDRNQQWYLIKQIDAGSETAKVVAQLDLDAWKATMLIGYSNGSATLQATINGTIPAGWTLIDSTGISIRRTIEGDYTPLEVVEQCRDTYGVYFRFDNVAQTITVIVPDEAQPMGAFATRDLNLKEINYKGKSTSFATRLYAYGADGLSFASINGGLPYVDDHTYSEKVVCAVWRDDRYTVAENLLEDAKKNLAEMAKPSRSYDCDVVDLAATNPEMYGIQDFTIFRVATLIDDAKDFAINYQIVERWNYPYYPEKNKVIFSSSPAKIQNQLQQITHQVESPNSPFRQQQQAAINNATNWITNGRGYMVAVKDADSNWIELCSLDTPDISTAKNVWRWNNAGFGHSGTGYNGPYTTAITQDGSIVADFITTGTLNAALATVINLNASNINTGTLNASLVDVINLNASNIVTGQLSASLIKTGTITASSGNTTWNLDAGVLITGVSNSTRVEINFNGIRWYSDNYLTGVLYSEYAKTYLGSNSKYTFWGWFSSGYPSLNANKQSYDDNFGGMYYDHGERLIHCVAAKFEIPGRIECASLAVNGREI